MFLILFNYEDSTTTCERMLQKTDYLGMTNPLQHVSVAHQYLKGLIIIHEAKLETLMFSALNMIIQLFSIKGTYFSHKHITFPPKLLREIISLEIYTGSYKSVSSFQLTVTRKFPRREWKTIICPSSPKKDSKTTKRHSYSEMKFFLEWIFLCALF